MKTKCSCCGSNNLRRCTEEDKDKYPEGWNPGSSYECLDCGMTDVLDVEDWK